MTEEDLTPEEIAALEEALGTGYPKAEEKQSIYSFFKRVITMNDTTRVANLRDEELGPVNIPIRTLLKLSLYAKEMGLSGLGNYFFKEAQVITNSSLGRDGFLDKLAVTQKREMETKTRSQAVQQKRGWFNKRKEIEEYK